MDTTLFQILSEKTDLKTAIEKYNLHHSFICIYTQILRL